jgi:hypothetical protein
MFLKHSGARKIFWFFLRICLTVDPTVVVPAIESDFRKTPSISSITIIPLIFY